MTPSFPAALCGGAPFTLWLDPARWPARPAALSQAKVVRPPLKLPSASFTLWLDPARWPARPVVELAPPQVKVAPPLLKLPGASFTLWLDPARWPTAAPAPAAAEPILQASALAAAAPESPPVQRIALASSQAFTLWTRPGQVTPLPMKNGYTAAQYAALVAARAVPTPAAGPAALGGRQAEPVGPPPIAWERWMPLGTAVVAVLGLNALVAAADARKAAASQAELSGLTRRVEEDARRVSSMAHGMGEKLARAEALAAQAQQQSARLTGELAKAQEANRQAEGRAAGQEAVIARLAAQLKEAVQGAAAAAAQAEMAQVGAQEEWSRQQRESGAALVALRQTLGGLEAEKAAAIRAAADAAAALAALQAKWDALPKAAPGGAAP